MRRAGYKSKNPDVDASRLLKHPVIKAAVEESEARAKEKFELKQEEIIEELKDIAYANIGDVLDWDDTGAVVLKAKKDMSKRGLTFIESIKLERFTEKVKNEDGEEEQRAYIKEIKVTSLGKEKVKALKLLGENIGLWKDKVLDDDSDGAGRGADPESRRAVLGKLSELLRKARK